ncbi:MAG: response regulator [Bdellovibrionales bacterium]|nr:response regulator [Bdellovibrionales bacterium]
MKILIVDDDKPVSALLQTLLKAYGETQVAYDGSEAIQKFSEALDHNQPFSLVCLDVMMPNISGVQALQLMREEERSRQISSTDASKVVIVSVVDDKEIVEGMMRDGADAYLSKDEAMSKLPDTLADLGFNPLAK